MWHWLSDLWGAAPSQGTLSYSTSSLCLDKCHEHTVKLRVFAMKWGSAARRLLWIDSSLARATSGKKVFKLCLRKNHAVSLLIIFFYEETGFLVLQSTFQGVHFLSASCSCSSVCLGQLQTSWKELIFQAAQNVPSAQVPFSHIWTTSTWRPLWSQLCRNQFLTSHLL